MSKPDDIESCGYAFYGPPALCTCGKCDVDADEQNAALDDLIETLEAITPEIEAGLPAVGEAPEGHGSSVSPCESSETVSERKS